MIEVDLQHKIVVVTGASGRFGQQVVTRFARAGAVIAAVVRREEDAQRIPFPEDGEGWAFPADVTDEASVQACFEQIGSQFGRIDVLIHAVGTWEARPLLETSLAAWEHILRVNLTSAFLCFREAARWMQGQGGRLIGFASGQGADLAPPQQGAYAAAKAGLLRLVEATAAELAATAHGGITAHAIVPSTILIDHDGSQAGVRADDLVELCVYLCSPAGAAHNGAALRAYGTG